MDSEGEAIPALIQEEDNDFEEDMQTEEVAQDTARAETTTTKEKNKPKEDSDAGGSKQAEILKEMQQ